MWKASGMFSDHFIILFLMTLTIEDRANTITSFLSSSIYLKGKSTLISTNRLGTEKNIKQKVKKITTPYSYFWLGRRQFPLCTIFSKRFYLWMRFLAPIPIRAQGMLMCKKHSEHPKKSEKTKRAIRAKISESLHRSLKYCDWSTIYTLTFCYYSAPDSSAACWLLSHCRLAKNMSCYKNVQKVNEMRFDVFNIYHFDDTSADLLLRGKALCNLWNVLNKVFDPINYGIMGKMRIYVAVDLVGDLGRKSWIKGCCTSRNK